MMKKFVCEFCDYPARQLVIEICEGEAQQRVEEWARAIASERDWLYIQTSEDSEVWRKG
jgi:hypothetical protein